MKEKINLTANVLFSGIGCQERGINNTGLFNLDVLTTSDIDKDAILSYAAIHCGLTNEMVDNYDYPSKEEMAQKLTDKNIGYDPTKNKSYDWFKLAKAKNNKLNKYWLATKLSNNMGDISKIERLPYADLWTISFCCQDISIAGKMKGFKPDSETRSSLLWTNIELLKKSIDKGECPKFLMFENVKNLVSKKFIDDFNEFLSVLNDLGFNSYWKVLNAKECGVPQNRERVFVISIRKDIDNGKFEFPKPFDIGIRLKDILEDNVDEKYYLSDKVQERFIITDKTFKKNVVGTTKPDFRTIGQRDEVYNTYGTMGALTATDYKQPKQVLIYDVKDSNHCIQVGNLSGGKWDKMYESARRYYSIDGTFPTLHTCGGGNTETKIINESYRVRKLIPRECYKLMGLTFKDCDNASNIGVADCNLYKQAGNGIVSDCPKLIFEHLYKALYDENYQCTDENFTQSQVD